MTIYAFDIDGTICTSVKNSAYEEAVPYKEMIEKINDLYNEGHYIKIFTARGSVSGKDWTEFTSKQLNSWGLLYHELITNKKPHFDLLIDDKAINVAEFRKRFL